MNNIFDILLLYIRIAFPLFVLMITHSIRHQQDNWSGLDWDEPVKVHETIHMVLAAIIFIPLALIVFGVVVYFIYFY